MALRFQPPNIPQPKSKTAAFTEGIQPGLTALGNLPSTIAYFQAHKAEMDQKNQALALQKRQTDSQFGTGAAAPAPLAPGVQGPGFQENPDQLLQRVGTQGIEAQAKVQELKDKRQPTWIIDEKGNKVGEVPPGVKVEKLASPYQAVIPTYDINGNVTGFTDAKPGTHVVGGGKPPSSKTGAQNSGSQLSNLNQLENLLSGVKTGPAGVGQKLKAIVSGGAVEAPAKVYNDYADAIAVGLYRNVTGDTRISDSDVGRARRILPFAYDSPEVRKTKLDFIRTALEAKQANESPSGAPSVGELFQGHKVLSVKKVQ